MVCQQTPKAKLLPHIHIPDRVLAVHFLPGIQSSVHVPLPDVLGHPADEFPWVNASGLRSRLRLGHLDMEGRPTSSLGQVELVGSIFTWARTENGLPSICNEVSTPHQGIGSI